VPSPGNMLGINSYPERKQKIYHVVKYPSKVLFVWEHICLMRKCCTPRLYNIDTWKPVFLGNLLSSELFLDLRRHNVNQ